MTLEEVKARTRATARKAFVEGFVAGLHRPLRGLLDPADAETRRVDLVLAEEAQGKLGLSFTEMKARGPSKIATRYASEQLRGIGAGRDTQLRWGVSSSGEQLAIEGPKG